MINDLTFFTNEPNATLLDRFKSTLRGVQYFDVLVGYFRTSGFHLLHEAFADIEQTRILVGLNVDRQTFEVLETNRQQQAFDFQSSQQLKQQFADGVVREMEHSADSHDTEIGVAKFLEFLQSGKLQLKAHPSQNIHAKVYISRFAPGAMDYGRVITGSSNFSFAGLQGQYEFNVELKDSRDVGYALEKFEALWAEAIDISEAYVDTIHQRTWLNDQITPYELYLKFLYEYFKEDINIDQEADFYLPDGFMDLYYQKQAVISAKKVLDAYGGVFLADVVGLGKTYISALLAQQLPGRKLVICPPVLQDYWKETFVQFGVGAVIVESLGKLDHIVDRLRANPKLVDYVFIDEAHRFRNEGTQSYEKLHDICRNRKVILVSATPLNNQIDDIFAQLKLFQPPQKSTIPGVRNLEAFFKDRQKELDQEEKGTPEYTATFKRVAGEVRRQILNYVMVRRTRSEIRRFFQSDMDKQGLAFPEVAVPQRIVYTFDPQTDAVFTETIERLTDFRYARYTPLLYLKKGLSEFEKQAQRNVGGFMKGILVKRLESSFFAFKNTLRRFIESYDTFIAMVEGGTVLIGKGLKIQELLDEDNEEELLRLIESGKVERYRASDFDAALLRDLRHDRHLLSEIQALWRDLGEAESPDPKLSQFIAELQNNRLLKGRKLIIFTESAETGRYLYQHLQRHFADQVLFYSSHGGYSQGRALNKQVARAMIEENYDPRHADPQQTIRLLVTTDVLAEGINLHRSNIVLNYDLPWNPTRVLQRVGRVNRVGTAHEQIYIFNFFPTAQGDAQLGLEANIKAKIQAFHDMLGEDAKYLTEEEDIAQHELFGERLYSRLNQRKSYTGEDEEERSELEYLQLIRRVRDETPKLFDKVKRLPKKARASRSLAAAISRRTFGTDPAADEWLVSFFRRGLLKKFYLNSQSSLPVELDFLTAVDLLACQPDAQRIQIPPLYYDLLDANKRTFAEATSTANEELRGRRGGRSNSRQVIDHLKAFRREAKYTEMDQAYVRRVLEELQQGNVPSNRVKRLLDALQGVMDPLKVLAILHREIPEQMMQEDDNHERPEHPVEVILSAYLRGEAA